MQSGSPLTPLMMVGQESGPVKLEKVLASVGCPHTPREDTQKFATFTNESYDCIRAVTVEKLMKGERSCPTAISFEQRSLNQRKTK